VPLSSPIADSRIADPTAVLDESELAEQLRQALSDLDDRQGHVFCRACVDGVGYREIAEELGITVNHVGVLLNRARSTLRERLQAFAPEIPTSSRGTAT
jgi:RNA polymerase sigma-70 factor (ECF subfamily)